ncbi:MAG: 3'-5' exonuclease [Nanoarchaeota archaeon]|nr:3'-5' exonuclease [Nanoarchaeota archaeon]
MIVVDIETTGIDFNKCGIWQIGAFELENPLNIFFQDARIDEEDIVQESALKIIGKNEQELRNKELQSQKELIRNFFKWIENQKNRNCICQNPQFDLGFLSIRACRYGIKIPFEHRAFDLHSIGALRYMQVNGKTLIKDNQSNTSLSNILKFAGMSDNRKIHNALEDSKLTGECFFRLVYGKNLFPEYDKFQIPTYLKKED